MDSRGNKGTKYKQSEKDLFVTSGWTCVRIVANTYSDWKGKVRWLPSVLEERQFHSVFCMIKNEME